MKTRGAIFMNWIPICYLALPERKQLKGLAERALSAVLGMRLPPALPAWVELKPEGFLGNSFEPGKLISPRLSEVHRDNL